MTKKRKLKRVVIQEELVALTGDHLNALILKQFLYWGERVQDFDKFIAEEKERDPDAAMESTHGWIYKSAEELADELMISVSPRTVARRIEGIIKAGWLDRRRNPHHAWDRTWQYRPNLLNVQAGLQRLGYALEGYPLLSDVQCIGHGVESIGHGVESIGHGVESIGHGVQALPEITTETTPEIIAEAAAEQQPPKLDINFSTALKEYQNTFGPLGSSLLYEKFQMLFDEYPDLKTHAYARKEMYRAMMREENHICPNLGYYAQCLATGAARAKGKQEERRKGDKRRNVPKYTVADINDPAIQAWLAERKEHGTDNQSGES